MQMIALVNQMLRSSEQPIALAVSSLKWAKLLYSYYSGTVVLSPDELQSISTDENVTLQCLLDSAFYNGQGMGEHSVEVVHGENSQTEHIQQLVNNLDMYLPRLRILIYTSSMGTGVDIQTPVQAVFGFFSPETIPADEMHQMLARCRHAEEYHVCILPHSRGRETSAASLHQRELQNADKTGRLFASRSKVSWEFGQYGCWRLRPAQDKFLRFWSNISARINRSLNNLKSQFITLALGEFEVVDCSDWVNEIEAIEQEISMLKSAHQVIDQHMILNAQPLDRETFNHRRDIGQYTPRDIAGYIRWTIEWGYRQSITEAIYEHWNDGGLHKLHTFINVVNPSAIALSYDSNQDAAGTALPYRSHSAQKRELLLKALCHVWGEFDSIDTLGAVSYEEINARMATYLGSSYEDLTRIFRWRTAHDEKPKNVINRLLRGMGLKLEKVRSGEDKGKYQINRDSLSQMQLYAQTYLAYDPNA